jgi:hypothetical protein
LRLHQGFDGPGAFFAILSKIPRSFRVVAKTLPEHLIGKPRPRVSEETPCPFEDSFSLEGEETVFSDGH